MVNILIINTDVKVENRSAFEEGVKFILDDTNTLFFFYDVASLRKRIICLCQKGCLHSYIIFHYGSSNDAVQVAISRKLKDGVYTPAMFTVASSTDLEQLQVKFSTSLINDKLINNSYLAEVFTNDITGKNVFWKNILIDSNYTENLQNELAKKITSDLVISKNSPADSSTNVISNRPNLNTKWIIADAAIEEIFLTLGFTDATISPDNSNIVVLKNSLGTVQTTIRFLEASGLLKEYDPVAKKITITKNVMEQSAQFSKQLEQTIKVFNFP